MRGLRSRGPVPTEILISCLADESAIARLAGDSPRAIAAVEEVRRLEEAGGLVRTDSHTDTLLLLSRAYSQAGRYRDAAVAAARSVEMRIEIGRADTPGMMNTQIIQATILREGGRPNEALPILSSELRDAPARAAPRLRPGVRLRNGADAGQAGESRRGAAAAVARGRGGARPRRRHADPRRLGRQDPRLVRRRPTGAGRSAAGETEPLYARLRADQQYTARQFLFAGAQVALAGGDWPAPRDSTRQGACWRRCRTRAIRPGGSSTSTPHGRRWSSAAMPRRSAAPPRCALAATGDRSGGQPLRWRRPAHPGAGLAGAGRHCTGAGCGQTAAAQIGIIAGPKHPAVEQARALAF